MTKDTKTPTIETTPILMDPQGIIEAKVALDWAKPSQKVLQKAILSVVCDLLNEAMYRHPDSPKLKRIEKGNKVTNRDFWCNGVIISFIREFTNGGSEWGPKSKGLLINSLKDRFDAKEWEYISSLPKMVEAIQSVGIDTTSDDDDTGFEV